MKQSSFSLTKRALFSPCFLPLFALAVLVVVFSGQDFIGFLQLSQSTNVRGRRRIEKLPFAIGRMEGECDIFDGRWLRDEQSLPHYDESECPYIQPQLTCQQHGRPDKEYQHWRWQPHGCDLPRFNATLMLETLREKRMMFVGDSLNRGQFISLVCLLHSAIPHNDSKSMETKGYFQIFTAKDYNATIEFYWAPFLLESNSDDAVIHRMSDRIVREGSIDKHGQNWKAADILVFNTYLWWMTGLTMKILQKRSDVTWIFYHRRRWKDEFSSSSNSKSLRSSPHVEINIDQITTDVPVNSLPMPKLELVGGEKRARKECVKKMSSSSAYNVRSPFLTSIGLFI